MAVVDGTWDPIHGLTKSETTIDSINYQLEKGIKKTQKYKKYQNPSYGVQFNHHQN